MTLLFTAQGCRLSGSLKVRLVPLLIRAAQICEGYTPVKNIGFLGLALNGSAV